MYLAWLLPCFGTLLLCCRACLMFSPTDAHGRHGTDVETSQHARMRRQLRARLLDPAGLSMPLRPALEEAAAQLLRLLSATVERPGANGSHLVIGARGTGKTLVWSVRAASMPCSRIAPRMPYGYHGHRSALPCPFSMLKCHQAHGLHASMQDFTAAARHTPSHAPHPAAPL